MTKFVHIVYVHPVENGEPNTYKVKHEEEFETKEAADAYIQGFNKFQENTNAYIQRSGKFQEYAKNEVKAVYYGCVNDETGELV